MTGGVLADRPEISFLPLGADRLEYRLVPAAAGAEGRAPLVLLHEGLGSVALWRGFPAALRLAVGRPTMLVYSRRGYGRSTPFDGPRDPRFLHDEALVVLPALLDGLGLRRPLLVGHSDGASIAIIHAGAGGQVAGLVLIAPHVFVEDRTLEGIRAARASFQDGPLRARLARHHADVDATFSRWSEAWLDPRFRSWNIEEFLPKIQAPTLVIQGSEDAYSTLAQVDRIHRSMANSVTTAVIEGVGHAPHLEAPQATLQHIRRHVEALDRGATPRE